MARKNGNQADEPLEKQLWKSADKLRKNIDAAEYKHVVLGLIFLKYISDAFEELYEKLKAGEGEYAGADPEDKDEYKAENVFFVPEKARWAYLLSQAKQPTIGKIVDEAMDAIEKENSSLKGVLPKVADTYHNWRNPDGNYEDIKGFCKSAFIDEVRKLDYVLTPGRYVGLPDEEDDFDFNERFLTLKAEFEEQLKEEAELNKRILENLSKIELKDE